MFFLVRSCVLVCVNRCNLLDVLRCSSQQLQSHIHFYTGTFGHLSHMGCYQSRLCVRAGIQAYILGRS